MSTEPRILMSPDVSYAGARLASLVLCSLPSAQHNAQHTLRTRYISAKRMAGVWAWRLCSCSLRGASFVERLCHFPDSRHAGDSGTPGLSHMSHLCSKPPSSCLRSLGFPTKGRTLIYPSDLSRCEFRSVALACPGCV